MLCRKDGILQSNTPAPDDCVPNRQQTHQRRDLHAMLAHDLRQVLVGDAIQAFQHHQPQSLNLEREVAMRLGVVLRNSASAQEAAFIQRCKTADAPSDSRTSTPCQGASALA